MGWLEGNVAVITGGGSGLGRALVERFIEEGAKVGVLERSAEKVKKLAADFGENVVTVEGDVSKYEDNASVVRETVRQFGRLDTFVGNAAIWDFSTKLVDIPEDRLDPLFDEMFHINVKGYLNGAKAAVKELALTGGSIVFTVSNAGFYPGGGGPLYTASKHAVVGLVKELAFEFAPKIRVNGVAPGAMATDLRGPGSIGLGETNVSSLPLADLIKQCTVLQELCEPADYTGHYVLLASKDNSRTATGAIINCDGGMGVRGLAETAGGNDL
ncbi:MULTISPECIES: 3-(cis-5,6-dihydroxycyclohexa-1,3-dien-1-yl)propanoate dehydrogenase [Rhodococcus]|uniref:Cis-3-phenylcyclohexa-3,5-diene-1,2-diol dehydrogenase n=1 Tax=Rhodococcus jostii (strain RHA1) TaxID=101510 RepID=Q75T42_RHOJR|nr:MULTISPECIES: 3-(cis-5,6-dihydroxycyclohexa-1,3-dien-1-yl)propanoate dehydrogenase [Rhodococcus]AAR90124.1 alkylbenzene dihydrodiol dehydrogenase [Rhodococcus sp. DK17]ABH00319.1 cis-3-phenylcyclohexa-3,5-diene-1,2-diol dehydrogenase [Rhodococcus jostii RHA1]BAD03967.1 dihydrodiol dehydrogenase [Rhodococcus jostii RHA1]